MIRRTLVLLDVLGWQVGFVADGSPPTPTTREDGQQVDFAYSAELDGIPPRMAPLEGGSAEGGATLTIRGEVARQLWAIRRSSPLQLATVTIYWWPEGELLRSGHEAFSGAVRSPQWELGGDPSVTIRLEPRRRTDDCPFPPAGVGDEGRFPGASDDSRPHAVPVVYGAVRGVPLYAITSTLADPVRMLLAGHRVVSTDVDVARSGVVVAASLAVSYATDGVGGTYAYVEVPLAVYGAGSDLYAASLVGWADPNGQAIQGLGDVLEHAFRTYGGSSWYELDRPRVQAAKPLLNRLSVGLYANERAGGGLTELFTGRIAGQFPVAFNFAGGRFGWDAALFPEDPAKRVVDRLIFGQHAHTRVGPTEPSADDVISAVELAYGLDGYAGGSTQGLRGDAESSGAARRALTRWGRSPILQFDAPDCPDASTAYLLLSDQLRKRGRIRQRLEYQGASERYWRHPMLGVVLVTDAELGLVDEPYLLEGVRPRFDGLTDIVLLQVEGL